MRHTISLLVENKFGVLSRVSGLFSGRGYNIESLSVGPTLDPKMALITLVTTGNDDIIEQITKQLNKLIDVVKVTDMTEFDHVERELLLIKVKPRPEKKAEVLNLTEIFRGRVIDSSEKTFTIEVSGAEKKLNAFIDLMRQFGIDEFVRSGKVAIMREAGKKK